MGQTNQIFISAAQADSEAAKALQRGLRRFRVPRTLAVPRPFLHFKRRRRMFRHEEENPRQSSLPIHILERIQRCGTMILVCSPHTAVSRWIQAEIEEFYAAHPRGRIIPLVMDGEPEPELAADAYVKPCLPENLNRTDAEYWIDARECDWEHAAPAAAIAALLGVRVEELVQHVSRRATKLSWQRSLAVATAAVAILGAGLWTWRQPVNDWAAAHIAGYSENIAPNLAPWLNSPPPAVEEEDSPLAQAETGSSVEAPPGPVPYPDAIPDPNLIPATAASAKTEAVPVPVESPEAAQVALEAWLDRAERSLPEQPRDAQFWLDTAQTKLDLLESEQLGAERYRFHALSAAVAQQREDAEAATQHLLLAIDHWTAIPLENPVGQEREAFEILATLAPNEAWRESALRLVIWISQLKGDENRVLSRAQTLLAFAKRHAFLVEPVDAWFAGAHSRITPPPQAQLEVQGRFILMRSQLAMETGNLDAAGKQLQEGRLQLAGANSASPVVPALVAQMGVRQLNFVEKLDSAAVAQELDSALPILQQAMEDEAWVDWFAPDLAFAWTVRGDLYLAEDAFETAAQAYGFALEHAPSEAQLGEILLKIGCAYRYSGLHREAWEAFTMAQTMLKHENAAQRRITAILGAAMAAREVKSDAEVKSLLDRANALLAHLAQTQPTWLQPGFWRESLEHVLNPEAAPKNPESGAEIARLQARIGELRAVEAGKTLAQLHELRALQLALERLAGDGE